MEQQSQSVPLPKVAADLSLILLASFLSLAYFLRSNPGHLLIFDDSYITLRFAENLFRYNGITYDGSTFLVGATSPLHIVCIAMLGLFMEMEDASLATGVVFFILSSYLVYLWILALYNSRRTALLGGVMMATSGWLIFDALNGMETTAFIFFSLLTFYLYNRCQAKPFYAIPLALSIFTRPEGWFIGCSLWMWQLISYYIERDRLILRQLFISLGLFLALIVPYMLLAFLQTGSFLPGTAYAKAVFFGESTMPFINKAGFFKNRFLPFYGSFIYPASLFILPLMLFARRVITLPYLWFYFFIFYGAYFIAYPGAIQNYWNRYQHVFIPFIIMAIAGGAMVASGMVKKRSWRIMVLILIAASILYNQGSSFINAEKTYANEIKSTRNPKIDLALWLKQNTPENALIALHDIGAVGYFSGRKILDLVGLVNPEVTGYYTDQRSKKVIPLSERKIIDYLKQKQPDYLVMFAEWDRFFNLLQPANSNYFQFLHTTLPLYPTTMKYRVFKCSWENND
jgi:hypothetical protein